MSSIKAVLWAIYIVSFFIMCNLDSGKWAAILCFVISWLIYFVDFFFVRVVYFICVLWRAPETEPIIEVDTL